MPNVSSNTGETIHIQQPVTIKNVLCTNESGGSLGVSIYRYKDTGGHRFLRLVTVDDVSAQLFLGGVNFPDGFSVVPDTGMNFFMVEYVALENS